MSLNNGPSMEFLTASIGQNFVNSVAMVNGLMPTTVNAGDVVKLTVSPLVPAPTPLIGGVSWTIDFTPVPEPSTLLLMGLGLLAVAWFGVLRRRPTTVSQA
jgi:hypothetical protein